MTLIPARLSSSSRMAFSLTLPIAIIMTALLLTACNDDDNDDKPPPNQFVADGGVSDFYTWQGKVPAVPGTLLRAETLPASLTLTNAAKGIRILYSSTDGIDNKKANYVSGDIQFPKGQPPRNGWPLIAWSHGTVGVADVCAPSWAGRSARDIAYLNAWLAKGYAIVATDYDGLGTPGIHPYLHARSEAYSVLDSIRTATNSFPELSKSVVIVGQSQGAQGAVATTGYASRYAPDIKLLGTVATGVPYNLTPLLNSINDPNATFSPVLGVLEAYAWLNYASLERTNAGFVLADHWTPRGKELYTKVIANQCIDNIEGNIIQDKLLGKDVFSDSFQNLTDQNIKNTEYPTLSFPTPIFIGTGTKDTDVPTILQYQFAKDTCAAGTTVEQHYYLNLNHDQTVNASLQDSQPFVERLFSNRPITSTCSSLIPPPS